LCNWALDVGESKQSGAGILAEGRGTRFISSAVVLISVGAPIVKSCLLSLLADRLAPKRSFRTLRSGNPTLDGGFDEDDVVREWRSQTGDNDRSCVA
jgi:hypothetical protein